MSTRAHVTGDARIALDMFAEGKTREEVAAALDIDLVALQSLLSETRRILGRDLPGHGAKRSGGFALGRAHVGPVSPERKAARRAAFEALSTPRAARSAICSYRTTTASSRASARALRVRSLAF
jgi:hypothetical protein